MQKELSVREICEKLDKFIGFVLKKMKIERKSENTIKAYNVTYRDFLKFCETCEKDLTLENIKEDDIYAFLDYKYENLKKQGELAVSTVNSIISHLKKLFKHIERNSDENYDFDKLFEDIRLNQPKKIPKGLSDDDVDLLMYFMDELRKKGSITDIRNIILFKLMMFGGLRVSESNTIRMKDFVLDGDGEYKITFIGKGKVQRITYVEAKNFNQELSILNDEFNFDKNIPIATTSNGKVMDRFQIRDMARSFYRRASVKSSGLHILRHTAAKKLLGLGVNITVVQAILGHKSIVTTSIYTNPSEDMIRSELKRSRA